MDQGRIVERGTHAELLAHGGRYAEMWRLQQSGEDDETAEASESPPGGPAAEPVGAGAPGPARG
jgi:ATP-binding cassette subfamily B protein